MLLALTSLLVAQVAALVVLLRRLMPGRHRPPPVAPRPDGVDDTTVSVVVPARNEALRIGPCLAGLRAQGAPLVEAIVVDGGSTDGTPRVVDDAAALDARIRWIAEPPRPPGAVGRPWAIATGCTVARAEWIMVVDADAAPRPGMIAGAVTAARARNELVSAALSLLMRSSVMLSVWLDLSSTMRSLAVAFSSRTKRNTSTSFVACKVRPLICP